ncbi:MAG: ankyrin repeat domain-containing protein [Candidatus Riflebacteria bacterium]
MKARDFKAAVISFRNSLLEKQVTGDTKLEALQDIAESYRELGQPMRAIQWLHFCSQLRANSQAVSETSSVTIATRIKALLKTLEDSGKSIKLEPIPGIFDQQPVSTRAHPAFGQKHRIMFEAIAGGNLEKVKELINEGTNLNAFDEEGFTPLAIACVQSEAAIVHLLLLSGASVDQANHFGWTPLMQACINFSGDFTVIHELMAGKAAVNARNIGGETAIMRITGQNKVPLVKFLLKHGAQVDEVAHNDRNIFILAMANGWREEAGILLEAGADPNFTHPSDFWTPLMYAVKNGWSDIAAQLVSRGANLDSTTAERQESALTMAAQWGISGGCRFLLEKGADPNHQNCHGLTALFWAAQNGNADIVRDLLARGANTELADETGQTPLMISLTTGHIEIVRLLLEHGADPSHVQTKGNWTPLHRAVDSGNSEMVRLLLGYQSERNHRNRNGETPLDLARKKGLSEIIKLLE